MRLFSDMLLMVAGLAIASVGGAQVGEAHKHAVDLHKGGDFSKAVAHLADALEQSSTTLAVHERALLEFEIERIERIRQDYKRTRAEILERVRRHVPDFTEEELDQRERNGELDCMTIDGTKFYMNAGASNLFQRDPALRARKTTVTSATHAMYTTLAEEMDALNAAANKSASPILGAQDVLVTYTLTVNAGAVAPGQTVSAWLPAPRLQPNQTDFVLVATEPANPVLSGNEAAHRTIYLAQPAAEAGVTTFTATYAYRSWGRVFAPSADKVMPYDKTSPIYQFYTASRPPHLDLDNEHLRSLNAEIVGDEKNPLLVAKKIFDWTRIHMIYQFAREYSTAESLSAETAKRRAGDCGQHAMFFIAMCRMNGVPARWSTGWYWLDDPTSGGMHDWAEIYVEPWGWMPCDPDVALLTMKNADHSLTDERKLQVSDWLFCNQDAKRMTVNADYGCELYPPKRDFRSETVDFQRGEVESNGKNLYFDKWDYDMQVAPLKKGELDKLHRR